MRRVIGTFSIALGLLGLAAAPSPALAASASVLSGGIFGQVKSAAGIAQMGATVLLYDRYDQLVRRALSNQQGKFAFDQLAPDSYSIRVMLASFVPAVRRHIAVAAGSENLLQVNLAGLFSTIDLISSGPSRGTLMSDEWKWVLRQSQATRPVLRILPSSSGRTASLGSIFSDTTGLVRVSASDGESLAAGSAEDLGTAFALATSLFGSSRVQFSGNIAYVGNSTVPTTGFRASYARSPEGDPGPRVTLTVHQVYLSALDSGGAQNGPVLRTASLEMRDSLELGDNLRIEYGAGIDSVSFLQRLSYLSPFIRATYDLGRQGMVRVAYSSGAPPTGLAGSAGPEAAPAEAAPGSDDLNGDLAALALLPRVSLSGGHLQVQRTQNMEIGYSRIEGSRTYSVAIYNEDVANAALTLYGPRGFVPPGDSLPDLGANDRIFNIGSYQRAGYGVALQQSLTKNMDLSVAGGQGGALATGRWQTPTNDASAVRGLIHGTQQPWVTVSFSGAIPSTGTFLIATYGWTPAGVLMPDHAFLTQAVTQTTGWNIGIRQPLPFISGMGRLEATAELRNLLAQGYLPLEAAGQKALLTNSPRSVRGGLAFIF
ncbi:MAG: carboxypeptidase-like regulatory domain-containing protein [Bryobacteraceae bacterium]